MTVGTFAPDMVDAPVVDARKGGLLAVADVRTVPNGKWLYGLDWQPEHCGTAHLTAVDCVDAPAGAKAFDGVPVVLSRSFNVYKGIQCDLFDMPRYRRMAVRGLELGEAEAVERYMALNILDGGQDLTPTTGTPVPLHIGLGMLEEWTAENYGAVPIIHGDRLTTTDLLHNDLLVGDPVNMRTKQGSLFANGAYRVASSAGERWLWATGEVLVQRGEVIDNQVTDEKHNKSYALAERPVAIGIECFIVKVLVSVSGAPAVTASPPDKATVRPFDVYTDAKVTDKAGLATEHYVPAFTEPWLASWFFTVGSKKYTWNGIAWIDYTAPQPGTTSVKGPFGSAFALPFKGVL